MPMQCLFLRERTATEDCITVLAEAFRSSFPGIQNFLTTIAEPTSRLALLHEYRITRFSLGTAVSANISATEVIKFLDDYVYFFCDESLVEKRKRVCAFVETYMSRYNLARIVIDEEQTSVVCKDASTAKALLEDRVVRSLCAHPPKASRTEACSLSC
ncbi:hypothetical protein TRVL_02891 [Trypanosoma vivax]|nr:hypothetical protein TRVL_02891 [Trypanosoma vivax]